MNDDAKSLYSVIYPTPFGEGKYCFNGKKKLKLNQRESWALGCSQRKREKRRFLYGFWFFPSNIFPLRPIFVPNHGEGNVKESTIYKSPCIGSTRA